MKSMTQRLLALHRALDREVGRELAQRTPDQLRLARLKRERLAAKDRLALISTRAAEVGAVARDMLAKRRGART